MTKKDRQLIFDKYNGKCAYCGCDLKKGWHVDHVEPVRRFTKTIDSHYKHKVTGVKYEMSEFHKLNKLSEEEKVNLEYIPRKDVFGGFMHPERNTISNMIPSCASCNINKHGEDIEGFRSLIKGFMKHLNESNTQYKIAKRYGLVIEKDIEVKFYFETI
jgi:5-methylcytosine-specific restriction endonuclease McrA